MQKCQIKTTYNTNKVFISNQFVCMWSPPLKFEIWLLKVTWKLLQNWGYIFYGVPRTINQETHWQHMLILFECNDICFMDYHKRWNIKVAFSSFILHYKLNFPNPSSFSKFMFMMSWSLVSGVLRDIKLLKRSRALWTNCLSLPRSWRTSIHMLLGCIPACGRPDKGRI